MKILALVMTGAIIASISAPCFAFQASTNPRRPNHLIQNASCNPNDEDKQARCMRVCDDTWIKASQAYSGKIDEAKAAKKACEVKCGC